MANLKDYLGSIASSVNQARALADFESAKIAQVYAKDNLLKNFSVPRFRAQDIELTIPIAIDNLQVEEEQDYQPIDNVSFNSYTYSALKDFAKVDAFNRKTSTVLKRQIAKQADTLEKELKHNPINKEALHHFAEYVSEIFVKVYANYKDINAAIAKHYKINTNEVIPELRKRLINKMQTHIIAPQAKQTISNANVIVEADKLKEIKPENLIQIKMKLVEDGMEWQTMQDDDGNTYSKLLPE